MSAIPAILPEILHYKGSTFRPISIKYNYDMTGCTFLCQIKSALGSSVIHEWKSGVNITVVDITIGHIILDKIYKFNPTAGKYVFDIEVDKPAAQLNDNFINSIVYRNFAKRINEWF